MKTDMLERETIPLLAVVGPTASGKTALAVSLAKQYGGEIVSADSMQIYREMEIATAKPSPEEQKGVPHHFIGCISMNEEYHVARYVQEAGNVIREIRARGRLPVLCGGTGLYVSSLIDNISFSEEKRDDRLRNELEEQMKREGAQAMLERLASFDPQMAASLHPNNKGRILRAVETYLLTGITMTEHIRRSREVPSPYEPCMIGIDYRERQKLYDRINLRVERMMEMGLLEETRRILSLPGGKTASQAIGYKELEPYLRGEISLEEAVSNLKQATRRYAKRQLTWFRRDKRIQWFYPDSYENWTDFCGDASKAVESFLKLWYTHYRKCDE